MYHQDLLYRIALTRTYGIGAVSTRNLVSYCGGVREVFEASKKELIAVPGIGEKVADALHRKEAFPIAEQELEFLEKNDVQAFFYTDKNYPRRFKHFNDSPALFYYKGTANLDSDRIVAIIGTRKPSPQGVAFVESLIEELLPYQPIILSGLAYGIDVTAHKKAMEVGLPTIGVLGHGLATMYPLAHTKIARQMTENGGLMSEYTSQSPPDKEHFPMRNRIVAGLCDALIVGETQVQGGSMITANLANTYHKDVFAIPGRPRDKTSEGCNFLIKSNKASLLDSADDIGYIMGWSPRSIADFDQPSLFPDLSDDEQKVIELIRSNEEIDIDTLVYTAGMNNSIMAATLLGLEFKGLVKPLPGKRFIMA